MSTDSTWDVQSALFAKLSADSNLTGLLANGTNSVLDHVLSGTLFPYVVIGETHSSPLDTSGSAGYEVVISIHTYSRGVGMNETRQIMSAIYDNLHRADFTVPNQTMVMCKLLDTETRLDVDGKTRHGVQRFQIITEPL